MSEINKNFIALSTKISELNSDRQIDCTKFEVENFKEITIRSKNDEILEDKINIITEEFNKLKNEIELIKNNETVSADIDKVDVIQNSLEDAQNIINNKEKSINTLKKSLEDSMKVMTKKIEEQNNLEKSNSSKELIDKVKFEIENLSVNIDRINDSLKNSMEDARLLNDAKTQIEKSEILTEINNFHDEIKEEEKMFDIMYKENNIIYENNMEIIETIDNIYLNIQKINKNKYKGEVDKINENLNSFKKKIDLQNLSVRKLNIQKNKILSEIKDLISNEFTDLQDVIDYKNKVIKELDNFKNINKTLIEKNNILEKNYQELEDIQVELDKLYKQIVEYQNETLKLKEEIENLKNELKEKKTDVILEKKTEIVEEKITEVVEENTEVVEEKITEVVEENTEVVEENTVVEQQLPTLKKSYVHNNETVNLSNELNNIENMSESEALTIFNNSIEDLKNIPKLEYSISINNITAEDTNLEAKDIQKNIIGKTVTANLKYNNISIIGQGSSIKLNIFNRNKYINKISFNLEETDNMVSIMNEDDALAIAKKQYDKKFSDSLKVNLCYYSFSNSDFIVPAYLVYGKYENIELLESIIPASLEHFPKIIFDNVNIESNSIRTINIDLPNNNDVDSNNIENSKEITTEDFKISINNLKYTSKVKVISVFDIVNNLEDDSSFIISLNKNISTSFLERINKIKCILSTENEFGFTFNIPLTLDFTRYSNLFNIIDSRVENPIHGGSIHNYGIEWAESHLGSNIYNNYVNSMNNYGIHKEYSVDSTESNKIDFKDYNNSGKDNYFIDNVDTSAYIGHGYGDGIAFENSNNDNILTSSNATGGDAWGNRDMEFQALMSCQVLKETYEGKNWAERWGPVFNKLHLLCSFQTNANVGEHKMLQYFADNQYDKKQTIMNSWFNAANNDQPNGKQVVVMGPLIDNSDTNLYNSVESSISGLYRAHWNDHGWGVKEGPGLDISKKNIKGWWRVVYTV